eukprot:11070079-Ditylum_brightwellii.AAC.1
MMTKGCCHVQMRENAVCKAVKTNFVTISHIGGKVNLSNIVTKEDRDKEHFLSIRDTPMSDPAAVPLEVVSAEKRIVILAGEILIPLSAHMCADMTSSGQEKNNISSSPHYPRGVYKSDRWFVCQLSVPNI